MPAYNNLLHNCLRNRSNYTSKISEKLSSKSLEQEEEGLYRFKSNFTLEVMQNIEVY